VASVHSLKMPPNYQSLANTIKMNKINKTKRIVIIAIISLCAIATTYILLMQLFEDLIQPPKYNLSITSDLSNTQPPPIHSTIKDLSELIIPYSELKTQQTGHRTADGVIKKVIINKSNPINIHHLQQFASANFQPDSKVDIHQHIDMSEIFYVLSGELTITLHLTHSTDLTDSLSLTSQQQKFTLRQGDTVILPPFIKHQLENRHKTQMLELLFFSITDQ